MSDVTEPTEPVAQDVGSVNQGGTSKDNDVKPESGVRVATVEHPPPPHNGGNSTGTQKQPYQWWDNALKVAPIIVSLIALGVSWFSYNVSHQSATFAGQSAAAAKRSADAAENNAATAKAALEANQRAYVSLGKADGTVAQYISPMKGKEKGTISLYFQNMGRGPANTFLVNVVRRLPQGHPLLAEQGIGERHIERWQLWREGKRSGKKFTPGVTLAANSMYKRLLDARWTPTTEEWRLITSGKAENGLSISGNLEYCDQWGKYHCEDFDIEYQPLPVGRFVVTSSLQCPKGFPPPSDPKTFLWGEGVSATPLPSCEQPGEGTATD